MPSTASLIVNEALSAFASGYSNNGGFIADGLFPVIEHTSISGTYFSKSKVDVVTVFEDLLGSSSEPKVVDYATTQTDFTLVPRGLMAYVPYAQIDLAKDPQRPREAYAATVMQDLLLAHERRLAVIAHTTGSYASSNTFAVSNPWTSSAGTPIADFHRATALLAPADPGKTKIVGACALEVAQALSRHPELLGVRGGGSLVEGVIQHGVGGPEKNKDLAAKLGLDELWVSDAQYATNARGATLATSRVWDTTKMVVARVPRATPSMEEAQSIFGCSFRWSSDSQPAFEAIEWDEPKRGPGKGSLGVKISHWTLGGAIIQNDMGVLMTTVTA